jgi:hypothetical protein
MDDMSVRCPTLEHYISVSIDGSVKNTGQKQHRVNRLLLSTK